jgi:hypothetical protein
MKIDKQTCSFHNTFVFGTWSVYSTMTIKQNLTLCINEALIGIGNHRIFVIHLCTVVDQNKLFLVPASHRVNGKKRYQY